MEQYRVKIFYPQMYYDRLRHNDKGDDVQSHPDENWKITSTHVVDNNKYFVSMKLNALILG